MLFSKTTIENIYVSLGPNSHNNSSRPEKSSQSAHKFIAKKRQDKKENQLETNLESLRSCLQRNKTSGSEIQHQRIRNCQQIRTNLH